MVLQTNIVPSSLRADATSSVSWPMAQVGQAVTLKAARLQGIRSVRGKYAFVPTSSDEFASRKQVEINHEG